MTDGPDGDRLRRAVSACASTRPARTAGSGRRRLLRYAQDLAWLHSAALGFDRAWYGEHGLTWLVRAAERRGPRRRSRVGAALIGTTRVVGFRRVWSRRRTDFRDAAGGARRAGSTSTGCCSTTAAPRRGSRRSSRTIVPGPAGDVRARAGRAGRPAGRRASAPVHGPAAGAGPDGPRQQRGLRRLARRGGHRRRRPGRDRRDPARDAPGVRARRRNRARALEGQAWSDGGGWSFRLADDGGADMLRARLEPLPAAPDADPLEG